jgi:hypothetical protein
LLALPTPDWALEIVNEVCAEYSREVPNIRFTRIRANGFGTSGGYKRWKNGFIRVSVGRDNLEKQIFLHELSHHLDRNGGHGSTFYVIFKSLLVKYDCLTDEYRKREYEYRKISLK